MGAFSGRMYFSLLAVRTFKFRTRATGFRLKWHVTGVSKTFSVLPGNLGIDSTCYGESSPQVPSILYCICVDCMTVYILYRYSEGQFGCSDTAGDICKPRQFVIYVLSNETWRENWCRKGGAGKEKYFAEWDLEHPVAQQRKSTV